MAENWFLGALIVTSTMPLEREILASLRTFDGSGLLALDSVSENLLIATTRVLMLASFPDSCWTWGWIPRDPVGHDGARAVHLVEGPDEAGDVHGGGCGGDA